MRILINMIVIKKIYKKELYALKNTLICENGERQMLAIHRTSENPSVVDKKPRPVQCSVLNLCISGEFRSSILTVSNTSKSSLSLPEFF